MPRKKKFDFENKLTFPSNGQLTRLLKDYQEPAVTPGAFAKELKWDFKPLWKYTNRESLAIFTKWLLRSPIFYQDEDDLHLRDPGFRTIRRQEIIPANVFFLLLGLSGEIANFFLSQKVRTKYFVNPLRKPLFILEDLKDYKSELISLGIVRNEDTFDKVYVKIARWAQVIEMGVWSTFFTNDNVSKNLKNENIQLPKSSSKSLGLMIWTSRNAFRLRKSPSPVTK